MSIHADRKLWVNFKNENIQVVQFENENYRVSGSFGKQ